MDNNKIVDNLNFIKIYFRIIIYKIIVAKKTWIIQKRDKNLRIWIENMSKCKAQLKKTQRMSPKHTQTRKCDWHPRVPFGTFGVPINTFKVPNGTHLGFGLTLFGWRFNTSFSTFSQKDASRFTFYSLLLIF